MIVGVFVRPSGSIFWKIWWHHLRMRRVISWMRLIRLHFHFSSEVGRLNKLYVFEDHRICVRSLRSTSLSLSWIDSSNWRIEWCAASTLVKRTREAERAREKQSGREREQEKVQPRELTAIRRERFSIEMESRWEEYRAEHTLPREQPHPFYITRFVSWERGCSCSGTVRDANEPCASSTSSPYRNYTSE